MKNVEKVKELNNIGFNKEKTLELIDGLKQDGVTVGIEDLGSYVRKQGLIVKVHIGRKRNNSKINPKVFGIDLTRKSEGLNRFFNEHMDAGEIKFLPQTDEKALRNIDSSIRQAKIKYSIAYDDSFMTLDLYKEFKEFFATKRDEYFAKRDAIVAKWEVIVESFKNDLLNSMKELNSVDQDRIYTSIVSKLPTKEEFKNSFYAEITATAFPVSENLDMFNEEIQREIREGLSDETIHTLYEAVGNTLNDAFQYVGNVINNAKKNDMDKIHHKTLIALKENAKRISQKNIFNNAKIEEIHTAIKELLKSSEDIDLVVEQAEIILAKTYCYALELGIANMIELKDSPLSEKELIELYEMFSDEEIDVENSPVQIRKMA